MDDDASVMTDAAAGAGSAAGSFDRAGSDDGWAESAGGGGGEPVVETRPCAHCGRPVPQRSAAGRPFRYCRDNDGECQRASRNVRMRHRASPGLSGEVARTWEAVDRLDQLVETLTDA